MNFVSGRVEGQGGSYLFVYQVKWQHCSTSKHSSHSSTQPAGRVGSMLGAPTIVKNYT